MKYFYTTLLACLVAMCLFAQPAGWSYVQPLDVQNNVATQVVNYQLQLTINTQTPIGAGQMNSDGSDIRFGKDCGGNTLYNYWIESGINTASTIIWVKIDTLPASGTRQIYMFYGNSSAPVASAIMGTFVGPHSSTDSVSVGSTGGVGNSQRGFRFAPTEDILMTAVGKNEPTGSTRYVTLFDFTTQAILSQQQVSGPAAQYSYANIATPLWLTSGTQYVLELFQGASDGYYFGGAPQSGQHVTYFDMRYCNSCTENTFPTSTLNGQHYGFVDMWYFTKQSIATVPTVTIGSTGSLATTNSGPATICSNDSVSISVTVNGGIAPYTYSWSPATGVANPNSAITMASPTMSVTYTCTIFDACGSGIIDSVTVTVNMLPTVTASVSTDSVCMGSSFTPMGGGAANYSWTGGLTDNSAFTPSATDTYTVTGIDTNGCSNSASVVVEVLNLPTVIANTSADSICEGTMVTLSGSGAVNYSWDNSITDSVAFSATVSMLYHVTGTDMYGCQNMDSLNLTVFPMPVIILNTTGPYCAGGSATVAAAGADTYLWNPGALTGGAITVNAPVTSTYTVTGTDTTTGCMDSVVFVVVVNQLPVVTASGPATVCVTDGNYSLTGTPASGTFAGPGVTGSTFNPTTAGNGTHQVIYSYTDSSGCSAMDTITIVVSPCVGIADNNASHYFNAYPNPFGDVLILNLNAPGTSHVRLFNHLGQIVFEQEMNSGRNEINTAEFASGVYMLEVTSVNGTAATKVIKQ